MEAKIIQQQSGILTNIEVLGLIHERDKTKREKSKTLAEVSKYLRSRAIEHIDGNRLQELLSEIDGLRLSLKEKEIAQLCNLLPEHAVELYLIIEDCEKRFDEEQVASIISVIQRFK